MDKHKYKKSSPPFFLGVFYTYTANNLSLNCTIINPPIFSHDGTEKNYHERLALYLYPDSLRTYNLFFFIFIVGLACLSTTDFRMNFLFVGIVFFFGIPILLFLLKQRPIFEDNWDNWPKCYGVNLSSSVQLFPIKLTPTITSRQISKKIETNYFFKSLNISIKKLMCFLEVLINIALFSFFTIIPMKPNYRHSVYWAQNSSAQAAILKAVIVEFFDEKKSKSQNDYSLFKSFTRWMLFWMYPSVIGACYLLYTIIFYTLNNNECTPINKNILILPGLTWGILSLFMLTHELAKSKKWLAQNYITGLGVPPRLKKYQEKQTPLQILFNDKKIPTYVSIVQILICSVYFTILQVLQ